MASRLNPESADFDVRRRALTGSKSKGRVERADDFFADDESEKEPEPIAKPAAIDGVPLSDSERERRLAEMKVISADLARLGYSAQDIAQILAGNWQRGSKVSGPVYEGFTLRSVPGKVLERLKGK
jgi:hypothetical protein